MTNELLTIQNKVLDLREHNHTLVSIAKKLGVKVHKIYKILELENKDHREIKMYYRGYTARYSKSRIWMIDGSSIYLATQKAVRTVIDTYEKRRG